MTNQRMIRRAESSKFLSFALFLCLFFGSTGHAAKLYSVALKPDSRLVAELISATAAQAPSDPCLDDTTLDAQCTLDSDADDVPDFRDICLPTTSQVDGLPPPPPSEQQNGSDKPQTPELSTVTGCASSNPLLLPGIRFRHGQSYLNVASRRVLNRVAYALLKMPQHIFEISSHTDNAGRVDVNQRLSEKRAIAMRHYLLLRGVNPTQLKARGYGETSPVFNNAEAAGRRANRRTELRHLD